MSTTIEWTQRPGTKGETWNPIRAENTDNGKIGHFCEKVSGGCKNCYASTWNARGMSPAGNGLLYTIENKPKVRYFLDGETLTQPLHWRKPRTVFVESMSDLFGAWVTDEWLDQIFAMMALCQRHTFQLLTKHPERMRKYFSARRVSQIYEWDRSDGSHKVVLSFGPSLHRYTTVNLKTDSDGSSFPLPNVWLGVSAEDQHRADERREHLGALAEQGWLTFVSYEPALGPVNWTGWEFLRWLIIGGESGVGARLFNLQWGRDAIFWCFANDVAPFFKQAGAKVVDERPGSGIQWNVWLADRKGKDPEGWPAALRVREYPR